MKKFTLISFTAILIGSALSVQAQEVQIGSSGQFVVDNNGNLIKINNVTYSFPSSASTSSILTHTSGGTLTWSASPTIGSNMITEDGGFAIRLINKTGSATVKGTLVVAATGSSNAFSTAPANSELVLGIVYENGIADGSLCYVVVSGIANVLAKNSVSPAPTSSYWVGASDVAGRAYFNDGNPGTTAHDREIGHCIETKASGTDVLVKAVLHFR